MNNSVEINDETTKWEVIKRLSLDLAYERGKVAYCQQKIALGTPYIGDVKADLAKAQAQAESLQQTLDKVLSSPHPKKEEVGK